MSGGLAAFALSEEDAMKMLHCETHVGATNVDCQSEAYTWKRRADGKKILKIKKHIAKILDFIFNMLLEAQRVSGRFETLKTSQK